MLPYAVFIIGLRLHVMPYNFLSRLFVTVFLTNSNKNAMFSNLKTLNLIQKLKPRFFYEFANQVH